MGSTSVKTPAPTPKSPQELDAIAANTKSVTKLTDFAAAQAERDAILFPLAREAFESQAEISERTQNFQDLLLPLQAESAGFDLEFDDDGNVTGITKREPTELEGLREDVELESSQATLRGLRGKIPVPEAFDRDREEGRFALANRLRDQLGSGFETSTPGIDALARFDSESDRLREGIRFGQLNQVEAIASGRSAQNLAENNALQLRLAGLNQSGANSLAFQQGGALFGQSQSQANVALQSAFGAAGASNQAAQTFQRDRNILDSFNSQAALQESANRQARNSAIIGAGSSGAGAAAGAIGGVALLGALPFSSETFKTDIQDVDALEVLEALTQMPVKSWRYKTDFSADQAVHVGPMAENFKDKTGLGDGISISLIDAFGLALAGIQALASENRELKTRMKDLENAS